jgi:GT2 family glycosyltransferase
LIKSKHRFIIRLEDKPKILTFIFNIAIRATNLRSNTEFNAKRNVIFIRNNAVITPYIFEALFLTNLTKIFYGDSVVKTKKKYWYEARPQWSKILFEQIDYLGDVILISNIDFSFLRTNFLSFIRDKIQILDVHRIEESIGVRTTNKVNKYNIPKLYDAKNIFHLSLEHHVENTRKDSTNISIFIPTAFKQQGGIPILLNCLESLVSIRDIEKYNVVLCFNEVDHDNYVEFKNKFLSKFRINYDVFQYSYEFNYSKVMNEAIDLTLNEKVILLNDDVVIENATKLDLPFDHFSDVRIGAVGINLFYPNGTFQHAGVELRDGEPQHFLKGSQKDYLDPWTKYCREVSGVTGAVLYLKKSLFSKIGKFDENYPLDYGDIDFMLRLKKFGYQTIICNSVTGVHLESATRGISSIQNLKSDLNLLLENNEKLTIRDNFLITCANRFWD